MAKDSGGGGCKRRHAGPFVKKLFVLAAIVGLFYGALFRVQTRAWPWEDWGAFFQFSKTSTQAAFEKGKEFTRDKVLPKTKQLLARAHDLLEDWDTESPDPKAGQGTEPGAEGEQGQEPGGESLGLASAESEEHKIEVTGKVSVEDVPVEVKVKADPERAAKAAASKASDENWRQARSKFKSGLKHYQQSSPEMAGSQEELHAAKSDFQESFDLYEKAKRDDPDNHLIERDLEEVQTFLSDCQRRLTVETDSY